MIFWILLFVLVVVISFLLAYLSMRNFPQLPGSQSLDYGLFLIRKTSSISAPMMANFHQQMIEGNFIISFERLFKGHQSTLVMFAPRVLAQNYLGHLDLVEVEDYITAEQKLLIFQLGIKSKTQKHSLSGLFAQFPILNPDEFVWWQAVLHAKKEGIFEILPRVAFFAKDHRRQMELSHILQNLSEGFLHKIPKPYTNEQMLKFYQDRAFVRNEHNLNLPASSALNLILLKHS